MGSFFAELKRRHIYRVAAAYAVVAWVLLQLVNNVAPVLDLPVWVARAFLLALVIGFPIKLLMGIMGLSLCLYLFPAALERQFLTHMAWLEKWVFVR